MDGDSIAPPKIRDVAARAGVSTATVSRALSAPDSVRTETREAVLAAVRDLGYTPNAAARNLRAGRSMMALVFVPKLANPFFAEVVRGIDAGLAAAGYGLIIGDLDNAPDKETHLVGLALAGHVDGVIVMSGRMPAGAGRSLAEAGLPMVGACARLDDPLVDNVLIDDHAGTVAQVRHLVGLGHRRLLYLSGPTGNTNDGPRYRGFLDAARDAGLSPDHLARIEGDYTFSAGARAANAVLAMPRGQRPTGLVSASDEMAIGFMKTIKRGGLSVPGDVSVVGFDGIEFADFCEPTLTTVVQPRRDLGTEAARRLLARIGGATRRGEDTILRTRLRLADSSGRAPSA